MSLIVIFYCFVVLHLYDVVILNLCCCLIFVHWENTEDELQVDRYRYVVTCAHAAMRVHGRLQHLPSPANKVI